MALLAPTLTPAQQAVNDALRSGDRPEFDAGLGPSLRAELDDALRPLAGPIDALGLGSVFINKRKLNDVHGCEARFLAEAAAPFEGWTIPMARGSVAHRAIELSMHVRGTPVPIELVEHAIARMAEDASGLGQFLQELTELDRADLRGQAVEHVCAFLELWPPLAPRWRPRSESKVRVELCGERILLQGKVDLAVGYAEGTTAGKVLVDFKTGAFSPDHLHDLRFYALLEAIARGVPPRRVATQYLDSARLVVEDVTEAMLRTAARRVIDGVVRSIDLQAGVGDPPVAKPGPACRWCPAVEGCEAGTAHLARMADW